MYSVGTYPREALFLHLKEATRSCKDYTIRGFNNYDDLLASLESHYGGEQKIIRAKNNNELEVLHKMKMVKRQLVKLGYEQKLDKFSISGMAKSCFSIATRNHFATKLAERSFELAGEDEITEGAYLKHKNLLVFHLLSYFYFPLSRHILGFFISGGHNWIHIWGK